MACRLMLNIRSAARARQEITDIEFELQEGVLVRTSNSGHMNEPLAFATPSYQSS